MRVNGKDNRVGSFSRKLSLKGAQDGNSVLLDVISILLAGWCGLPQEWKA